MARKSKPEVEAVEEVVAVEPEAVEDELVEIDSLTKTRPGVADPDPR